MRQIPESSTVRAHDCDRPPRFPQEVRKGHAPAIGRPDETHWVPPLTTCAGVRRTVRIHEAREPPSAVHDPVAARRPLWPPSAPNPPSSTGHRVVDPYA